MTTKLYPFSAEKHAHDLEFRRNRAMNEFYDKDARGVLTDKEYAAYRELIDGLEVILLKCIDRDSRGIIWLTGKEIGLAKSSMAWAACMRG